MVDEKKVGGLLDQAKGMIKQTIGKITGNEKLQAEGKADKLGGHVKEGVGDAKDTARGVRDDVKSTFNK